MNKSRIEKFKILALSYKLLEIDLKQLREFTDMVESFLKDEREQFKAWAKETTQEMSEPEAEEFLESHINDYWRLDIDYPNILRKGIFVTTYSLLENMLVKLCKSRVRNPGILYL